MRRICFNLGRSGLSRSGLSRSIKLRPLSTAIVTNEVAQLRSIINDQDKRISKLTYDLEQSQKLINEIPNTVTRIDDKLSEHDGRLFAHAEKLFAHAEKLFDHAEKLAEHAEKLSEHADSIYDHSGRLIEHDERICLLNIEIKEIIINNTMSNKILSGKMERNQRDMYAESDRINEKLNNRIDDKFGILNYVNDKLRTQMDTKTSKITTVMLIIAIIIGFAAVIKFQQDKIDTMWTILSTKDDSDR